VALLGEERRCRRAGDPEADDGDSRSAHSGSTYVPKAWNDGGETSDRREPPLPG
jgi:hypothetical protein